jgi:hypothetical protein
MKVFLAGPIDYWWNENWDTPAHKFYKKWRDEINRSLVEAGHCVYRPHEAIKGAWDESMQEINNTALRVCDVVVYLTPKDVPAYGTAAEVEQARIMGKPTYWAPPGYFYNIEALIVPLDDPYGDVQRKSYTKENNELEPTPGS